MRDKLLHYFIIGIFCSLYFLVATISMINSVAFFDLAHDGIMNWALAIGFELGAAASLAAIIVLDKTNKTMVWGLFIILTAFQTMANSYHAFVNLEDYMEWIQLMGLEESEPLFQKRVLSIVSGALLPIIALGFIKSLVDYIRPSQSQPDLSETEFDLDELDDSLDELEDSLDELEDELNDLSEEIKEETKLNEDPIEDTAIETDEAADEPLDKVDEKPQEINQAKVGSVKITPNNSNGTSLNKKVRPVQVYKP